MHASHECKLLSFIPLKFRIFSKLISDYNLLPISLSPSVLYKLINFHNFIKVNKVHMDAPVMSTRYLPLRADFNMNDVFNLGLPLIRCVKCSLKVA